MKLKLLSDLPADPDRRLAIEQLAAQYLEFSKLRHTCESNGLRVIPAAEHLIVLDMKTDSYTYFEVVS